MADHDQAALSLRAEGLTYREIGERLGITTKQAWRACNREYCAAEEKRRRAYKREHENGRRAPCPSCGGLMQAGSAVPSHRPSLCRSCYSAIEAERIAERDREIEALWAAGASMNQIADLFGWSPEYVSVEIDRARSRGADLPYRYRTGKRNAVKFPHLQR